MKFVLLSRSHECVALVRRNFKNMIKNNQFDWLKWIFAFSKRKLCNGKKIFWNKKCLKTCFKTFGTNIRRFWTNKFSCVCIYVCVCVRARVCVCVCVYVCENCLICWLEISTTYYTCRGQYWVQISSDLHLLSEKINIFEKSSFFSDTITGVKVNQSSRNLAQR